ncbi:hypothetical protein BH18THE2_BH18THE2_15170 [soil metagenome]
MDAVRISKSINAQGMLIFVRADLKVYYNLCYARHKIYLCYIQSLLKLFNGNDNDD